MKSAHQMSSAALKLDDPSPTTGLWPEEDYSAFYKQQLYLAVLDDFAAFSGGIHKYADHIIRKLLIAHRRGQLIDFEMSWVDSPEQTHLFHGRNLRNFIAGKNSAHAIWAVFDLYIKLTQPLIAKGFQLEGYLERLGLVVSDFINPHANITLKTEPQKTQGLFGCSDPTEDDLTLYLHIKPLEGRRFSLAHFVKSYPPIEPQELIIAPNGETLTNEAMQINKGVLIPLGDNHILMVRDIEMAEVNLGFLKMTDEDKIEFRLIAPTGNVTTLSMTQTDNQRLATIRRAIMNALFEAAKRGDVKALKRALKDPNIDPNAQDERTGFTALHVAVVWQNKVCLYELLDIANLNLRDNFGRRPFDV